MKVVIRGGIYKEYNLCFKVYKVSAAFYSKGKIIL